MDSILQDESTYYENFCVHLGELHSGVIRYILYDYILPIYKNTIYIYIYIYIYILYYLEGRPLQFSMWANRQGI